MEASLVAPMGRTRLPRLETVERWAKSKATLGDRAARLGSLKRRFL